MLLEKGDEVVAKSTFVIDVVGKGSEAGDKLYVPVGVISLLKLVDSDWEEDSSDDEEEPIENT